MLQEKEVQQNELFKSSKISLILESYDDIFSDFDPRPTSERALSEDFLTEAKNAARDKASGEIEIIFMVPAQLRRYHEEAIIKKRLHDHFRKHYHLVIHEIRKMRSKGINMAIVGVLLGFLATWIATSSLEDFLRHFFIIVLEPASWFSIWSGFDYIFLSPSSKKSEHDFYEKMSKVEISFQSY